jgi:hypothetical protein
MRFGFLSTKSVRMIGSVLVYLANTIRSQSFSPSQRVDPIRTSWLCFTPNPPVGFWSSEVFPLRELSHLSMRHPLLPLSVTSHRSDPSCTRHLACYHFIRRISNRVLAHSRRSGPLPATIRHLTRSRQNRQTNAISTCDTLDFRGLIRRSIRTRSSGCYPNGGADPLLTFTLSKEYLLGR